MRSTVGQDKSPVIAAGAEEEVDWFVATATSESIEIIIKTILMFQGTRKTRKLLRLKMTY